MACARGVRFGAFVAAGVALGARAPRQLSLADGFSQRYQLVLSLTLTPRRCSEPQVSASKLALLPVQELQRKKPWHSVGGSADRSAREALSCVRTHT